MVTLSTINNMEKKWLYVFDYSIPDIFKIDITDRYDPDDEYMVDDVLYEHGHQPDSCTFMITSVEFTEIREDRC